MSALLGTPLGSSGRSSFLPKPVLCHLSCVRPFVAELGGPTRSGLSMMVRKTWGTSRWRPQVGS